MQKSILNSKSKKISKVFAVLFLCLTTGFSSQTFAATKTIEENGVKFTVSTDKDNYEIGENVNLTVSIDNKNDWVVMPKVEQVQLPKGLVLNSLTLPTIVEGNKSLTVSASALFDPSNAFEQWTTIGIDSETLNVGIRALGDVFENGSTFFAREIPFGTNEWNETYGDLDNKSSIEHIKFMDLGVKKPNSEERYTTLNGKATILVEVPKGWDIGELEARFVSTGKDETYEEFYESISGKTYLCWHVTHFSPYAVIDQLTAADVKTEASTTKAEVSTPKTGDNVSLYITIASVAMILALILIKKTRKNIVSLLLCALFIGSSFYFKNANDISAYEKQLNVNLTVNVGGQPVDINATFKCEWKAFAGEGRDNLEVLDNGYIKLKVFNEVLYKVSDIKLFDTDNNPVAIERQANAADGIVFSVTEGLGSEATYTLRLYGENGNIIDEFDFETEYDGTIII